jgi:hypothetical protein
MPADTYCPSCETTLPASAFLAEREPGDIFGASLRCRPCLLADVAREDFLRTHRRSAKADPSSPLAAAWRATRQAQARAVRAAHVYAQGLTVPAFPPALAAA